MPTMTARPKGRAAIRAPGADHPERPGSALWAASFLALAATLVSAGALASCNRAESRRVAADAQDAARQTAAGLDHAAAQAQPVADRAARDAKRGVNDLAIAAGKATRKAGVQLEHAGERAQQGSPPRDPSASN
jgi:hypothetical protein